MLDELTQDLIQLIINLLDVFPDDPFLVVQEIAVPGTVIMSYVNWFVDFPSILNLTAAWCVAILGWYIYSIVLRWVKLAG